MLGFTNKWFKLQKEKENTKLSIKIIIGVLVNVISDP